MIAAAMEPITTLEQRIESVRGEIESGANLKANRAALKEYRKALEKANHDLKERIRGDERLQNLLEENILPDKVDEAQLKAALKPHQDAQKKVKESLSNLSRISKELDSARRKFETAEKTVGVKKGEKVSKNYEALKSEIEALKKEHAEAKKVAEDDKKAAQDAWVSLMDDVESGKIRRTLYYREPKTGKISFKDPNKKPKFRPHFGDTYGHEAEDYMRLEAQGYRAKITGTSADKMAANMM